MGLQGEWWIDELGMATFADGDVGDINHEGMAFFYALALNMDDPEVDVTPSEKFTARQIEQLREHGSQEDAIQALKGGRDAREYQIEAHNWIRVHGNQFQLNDLDDEALKRIQNFLNDEYPEDEDPLEDTFGIEEIKKNGQYVSLTGEAILNSGKSAAALKYSAQRERPEWHNPGGAEKITIEQLPDDMQVLIGQFVDDRFWKELFKFKFTVISVPLSVFPKPDVDVGEDDDDSRGEQHALDMMGQKLPPVILNGDIWLDGRHRVWAAKKAGLKSISAIDLAESGIPLYPGIWGFGDLVRKDVKTNSEQRNPRGKPPKLGDIWAAGAQIKVMDFSFDPPRWKTLATCMDTPAAIGECIRKNNLHGELWVFGAASGKVYLGRKNPGKSQIEVLPAGAILYHGSPEPYASEIARTGKLVSRSGRKMGGGTMEEGGLIWFSRDERVAQQWAHGTEARPSDFTGPGQVFRIKLTAPAKFISRYAELTAEEAQMLNSLLAIPDYKPVKAGDRVSLAAHRAYESSRRSFEEYRTQRGEMKVIWPVILEALGVDGFEYSGTLAVAADQLELG